MTSAIAFMLLGLAVSGKLRIPGDQKVCAVFVIRLLPRITDSVLRCRFRLPRGFRMSILMYVRIVALINIMGQ